MATGDTIRRHRRITLPYFAGFLLLSLILLLRRSPSSPAAQRTASTIPIPIPSCNYSYSGAWIQSRDLVTPRYSHTCKEIYKGWSCANKSNRGSLHLWIWKPSSCPHSLPQLVPRRFLDRFRDKNIGFVGDSLNRNMFASLVCMLRQVAGVEVRKWRPAGADRGFTFLGYNLTLAYHRTNLLARYGR